MILSEIFSQKANRFAEKFKKLILATFDLEYNFFETWNR